MNWSGGNERSTPSRAFLLLVHLSRTEPVAETAAPAACGAIALAPAAPRTARPPALISAPRVVPTPSAAAALESWSDIVTSGGGVPREARSTRFSVARRSHNAQAFAMRTISGNVRRSQDALVGPRTAAARRDRSLLIRGPAR